MWKDPFRAPEATIGKREAWRRGSAPSGRLHWEEAGASGGPGLQNPGVLGSRLGVQAADWPIRPFSSSSFSPCPRTNERTEGSPLQRPWAWAPCLLPCHPCPWEPFPLLTRGLPSLSTQRRACSLCPLSRPLSSPTPAPTDHAASAPGVHTLGPVFSSPGY